MVDVTKFLGNAFLKITDIKGPTKVTITDVSIGKYGRHRGWLPKNAVVFLRETIRVFGVPRDPLSLTKGASNG